MSNFDFLQAVGWPEMHADCARAECYLTNDPRSACFYSRRAVEELVGYLYDVLGLPLSRTRTTWRPKINDAAFKPRSASGSARS